MNFLSLNSGFCITYTALLMKTWRVSLTYRVKSAHKVKLTDKQLLQWMVPILLVMGIYLGNGNKNRLKYWKINSLDLILIIFPAHLGTWTAAEPPHATEVIGLTKFLINC